MTKENPYTIVMLGVGSVGKSAITIQFVKNYFRDGYTPTIEENYKTTIDVDSQQVFVDIIDTAGQEEYSALRDQYLKKGHGFIFVFSIVNEQSFYELDGFHEQLYQVLGKDKTTHIPFIIAGNKSDLESERQVPADVAKTRAMNWGVEYMETSAKQAKNIKELFIALARDIKKHRKDDVMAEKKPSASESKGCCVCM